MRLDYDDRPMRQHGTRPAADESYDWRAPSCRRSAGQRTWCMLIVMYLNLDPAMLADLTALPSAAEEMSAAGGWPLITVDVPNASAARHLVGVDITALPAVVVACVPDFGAFPAAAAHGADVILCEDERAPAPFVTWPDGIAAAVGLIDDAVAAAPVAGATLALLMRGSAGLTVPAAVVAESAAYSALQGGEEFRRWRAAHPRRKPPEGDAARPRVRARRADDTVVVTLDRPARRNAVDWRMRDALAAALAGPVSEAELRVELHGAGPDFCAGGDLDEFGTRPDPALAHLVRLTRSPALLFCTGSRPERPRSCTGRAWVLASNCRRSPAA